MKSSFLKKGYLSEMTQSNTVQILALFLSGLLFRLYAFKYIYIINKDGVYYINQAKAVFSGNWELAKTCGFQFLSLYHLLIPLFYKMSGDWIIAAKSISVLFGTAATIIFYFIMKQFFRNTTAFLGSLAFSLNPFFVEYSVAIVKDPIFWFFALLGLLLFTSFYNSKSKDYFLMLSSLSFLIAGLARFEILIYYIGAGIYILTGDKKFKRFFIFNIPLIVMTAAVIVGLLSYKGNLNLWQLYLAPRFYHYLFTFTVGIFNADFLQKSIQGIHMLFSKILKTLYIPFLPFLIAGLWSMRKELHKKKIFIFFIILIFMSGSVLFLFYFKTGILSWRYTALFVFPCYLFIGFGVERIARFFTERGVQDKLSGLLICIAIFVLVLPADLKHKRADKVIYKDIGTFIASREENQKTIIMAPDIRIMFYANVRANDPACVNKGHPYEQLTRMKYQEMFHVLKENKVQYFIWDENSWKNADYDFRKTAYSAHFEKIMYWDHGQNQFIAYQIL